MLTFEKRGERGGKYIIISVSAANSQEISINFNKYLFGRNKYFLAYFWEENKYRVFFFLWIQSGGCKSAILRSFEQYFLLLA